MQGCIFIGATNYDVYCRDGRQLLQDAGLRLIENKKSGPYTREELIAIGGQISGVISGCELWDEETISAAPGLKVIVKFGVGVDNIDLEAAKRHGVQVANCPGLNAATVAEQTMALLLATMRGIPALDRSVREGAWERRVFPDVLDATFGVLGFGAVGQAVAVRAKAFGANVLVFDKIQKPDVAEQLGVKQVSLDEVFRSADIITVHLPAFKETEDTICRESIAKMKDGVFIVNTARGSLVNEEDVAEALKSGKLGGYASDVFKVEPMGGRSPLAHSPNTVLSPHLAGESLTSYREIGKSTARGMIAVHSGAPLANRIV